MKTDTARRDCAQALRDLHTNIAAVRKHAHAASINLQTVAALWHVEPVRDIGALGMGVPPARDADALALEVARLENALRDQQHPALGARAASRCLAAVLDRPGELSAADREGAAWAANNLAELCEDIAAGVDQALGAEREERT